jgi:hypothetical protein
VSIYAALDREHDCYDSLHSVNIVHITHEKLFHLLFSGNYYLHFAYVGQTRAHFFGVRPQDHLRLFHDFLQIIHVH